MAANDNWSQNSHVRVGDEFGPECFEESLASPLQEVFIFGLPELDVPCCPQQPPPVHPASMPPCQQLHSIQLAKCDSSTSPPFESSSPYDLYQTGPIDTELLGSFPPSPTPMDAGSWDASFSSFGSFEPSLNNLSPTTAFETRWTLNPYLTTHFSLPASPGIGFSPTSSFNPSPSLPPVGPTSFPSLAIPELDLAAQFAPSSSAPGERPLSSVSRPRAFSNPNGIPCPHCSPQTPKTFKRRADLSRHIAHMHSTPTHNYACDYGRCTRRQDPFHRRDHYRDHLREFHREDIEKRGGDETDKWYRDRNVVKSWWRCNRCLCRVNVGRSGWECHECGGVAGKKRQELRS